MNGIVEPGSVWRMDSRRDAIRAAYDADAARRDAMTPDEWRTAVVDEWKNMLVEKGLRSVLELGCGTGQLSAHMVTASFDVTAIDLSDANVEAARARGVDAAVGDFTQLPFQKETFDAAFAINTLLHVATEDLGACLMGIRDVLRPQGSLLIVVWGGRDHEGPIDDEWLEPPRYFRFYTDDQFAALPTPGFRRVRSEMLVANNDAGLHPQVTWLEAT